MELTEPVYALLKMPRKNLSMAQLFTVARHAPEMLTEFELENKVRALTTETVKGVA